MSPEEFKTYVQTVHRIGEAAATNFYASQNASAEDRKMAENILHAMLGFTRSVGDSLRRSGCSCERVQTVVVLAAGAFAAISSETRATQLDYARKCDAEASKVLN